MDTQQFDLAVIGAGPGGYVAAIRGAQLGLKVACVERESQLGGTCLRIGCIPSKALLESSERFHEAHTGLAAHGIRTDRVELDLAAMLQRKDKVVQLLTRGIEGLFKKNHITRFTGTGKIAAGNTVVVEGGNQPSELRATHILIATGSRSAPLDGVELDGDRIGTSTEALSYPEVPEHLVVIGAGYIGLELGSVWRRLGAKVTVLEFLDRILPGMDAEIAGEAHKIFQKQGIGFHLGCRVTAARANDGHCVVEAEGLAPIRCDRVLLAVGRVPNTEGLGLHEAGVAIDARGRIEVDEYFATNVPGIYAIGDVIRGPML
ncbi:MAG: NAD(P)/FAD-dependent oxidoreductase, partial [Verrucomicrobiae bacterium]|nr:NAD(P)/FAD-dependent oxidoreductase [Verrucomicrobiae bacterium]